MIHISNENILCDIRCKWYQENVLSYPKLLNYDVLFRENVFRRNQFYVSEIKHGGGRNSDSSAQVLRNSRLEFRLLPPSQRFALQISFRSRSERMPGERIAKHLSERAPTPPATMWTSSATFATYGTAETLLGSTERLRFIWNQIYVSTR